MLFKRGFVSVVIFIILLLMVIGLWVHYQYNKKSQTFLPSPIDKAYKDYVEDDRDLALTYEEIGKISLLNIITGKKKLEFDQSIFGSFNYASPGDFLFSPDKKWILFSKDYNLWKIGIDGNNLKQLTSLGNRGSDNVWGVDVANAKWSPNGEFIVYSVSVDSPGREWSEDEKTIQNPKVHEGIWLMDSGGGSQKFLGEFRYSDTLGGSVSWVSDNRRIIFNTKDSSSAKTYDIETGMVEDLPFEGRIEEISWSSDSTMGIVRVHDGDAYTNYLLDGNFKISGSTPGWRSSISPNGELAILQKYDHYLFLWDTRTLNLIKLPILASNGTPRFSWDGTRIVYFKYIKDPPSQYSEDLFVYDLAAKEEKRLTYLKTSHSDWIQF